jgi:hypothetical protein
VLVHRWEEISNLAAQAIDSLHRDLKSRDPDKDFVSEVMNQLENHLLVGVNSDHRKWVDVL